MISEWPTFHISHAAGSELVVHRLRALHLADELRARDLGQHSLAEQDHQLIAPQDPAGGVDRADAIGVAVERDAELGTQRLHGHDQIGEVLGLRWVGMVVWEAAVEVAVERHDVEAQLGVERDRCRSSGTVAGIDDNLGPPWSQAQLGHCALDVCTADALGVGVMPWPLARCTEQLPGALSEELDRFAV